MKERLLAASYIVDELSKRISIMLGNKDAETGHLWDYFPQLYQKQKEAFTEYQQQEELEQFKERRRLFAARHNKRWSEEHGTAE